MKPTNSSLLLLLTSIIFSPFLYSFNITKLTLKKIVVENKTKQPEDITVTFWEKCPGCPRLHGEHKKTLPIKPNEKITVEENDCIIKNIVTLSGKKFLNPEIKKGNLKKLVIQSQKQEILPLHVDFKQELASDEEYKMLTQKHEDYIESMPKGSSQEKFFKKIHDLYKKNNLQKRSSLLKKDGKPKISRIIHTMWFGKTPMPSQFTQWMYEWRKKHPKWQFMLWNEEKLKNKKVFPNGLYNQKIFDEAKMMYNYAAMSKIARYEVLHRFGGVYIDPDLKCFESLEHLHYAYDFYAGLGTMYKTFGAVNNGIIGSRSRHPILKRAMEIIKSADGPLPDDDMDLYNWTARNLSMRPITQAVYERAGNQFNDIIFPRSYFDGNEVEKEFYHTEPIFEAGYEHIKHKPHALCARGPYSYVAANPKITKKTAQEV